MAPIYASPTTTMILYEKLDVSIVELETKRSLKVVWTGIHNKEEGVHQFLLPKTNMVHDLADNLARVVKLLPGGTSKIRIFEISKDGKTQKEFTGSEMIGNIPEPVELYAEVGCNCIHFNLFLSDYRRSLEKNLRLTTLTRSSVFSISQKSCHGRMACLSSSL